MWKKDRQNFPSLIQKSLARFSIKKKILTCQTITTRTSILVGKKKIQSIPSNTLQKYLKKS